MSIMYYSDVKDKYGYANISDFPKDFDVDSIHEDLNVCEKCGDICNSFEELYWQGEQDMETNDILGDYTAVCDDCFSTLKKDKNKA